MGFNFSPVAIICHGQYVYQISEVPGFTRPKDSKGPKIYAIVYGSVKVGISGTVR